MVTLKWTNIESGADEGQASMLDSGIAAFALIFHSTHIDNFQFRCEGLNRLQGAALAASLRRKRGPEQGVYRYPRGAFRDLPRFKARAWIAASSGEVLRIET